MFTRQGRRTVRRALALAAVCGLAAAGQPGAMATTPAMGKVAGADPVPPPNLPDPVELTVMACEQGQVDVSSARAEVLASTLDLDPAVAQRVVEGRRPYYLTVDHLKYVSGIGPGELAAIKASGRACTAPPATPPPTDGFVCLPGDGRIDMNHADDHFDRLVDLYGRPTAERIAENAPYAGLAHVLAETVGGAGKGKQGKHADRLCVTPPTVEFADVTYGWVSEAGGAVTHTDRVGRRYRLSVPADVVAASGIWGSAEPADAGAFVEGLVAADVHLFGDWEGIVHVGTPVDPDRGSLGDGWEHAVLHFGDDTDFTAEDALTIQANGGVALVDGLVTVASDNLSPFLAIAIPAAIIVGLVYQPFGDWLTNLVRGFLGMGGSSPTCSPDITDSVWNGITIATSGDALNGSPSSELVHHCVAPNGEEAGRWTFVGNSGAVVQLSEQHGADIVSGGLSGNLAQALLFSGWNYFVTREGPDRAAAFVTPGAGIDVVVQGEAAPPSEYTPGRVLYSSSPAIAAPATLAWAALGLIGPGDVGLTRNYGIRVIYDAIVECAPAVLSGSNPDVSLSGLGDLIGGLEGCAENAVQYDVIRLIRSLTGDGTIAIAKQYARVSKIILAATAAVAVIDFARALHDMGPFDMTFRLPPPPPRAAPDSQASNPDVNSPPEAGYLIKSPGTPRSYYVVNRVAKHVPDGWTYVCLAQRVPTQFEVDEARFAELVDQISPDDATCPGRVEHLEERSIGAVRDDGTLLADGFLLRMENGDAYLVKEGYRVPLFSGPEHFQCLAATRLTWDIVTERELWGSRIKQHPYIVATGCL